VRRPEWRYVATHTRSLPAGESGWKQKGFDPRALVRHAARAERDDSPQLGTALAATRGSCAVQLSKLVREAGQ
jgi:hypothetical protein